MITTARYHIGQRGLVQIGSEQRLPPTSWRKWTISQEKMMYGTTIVVASAHRWRRL